jgi:NCS2 family nucleobase:cation symporter-2/xanthine permease XanP
VTFRPDVVAQLPAVISTVLSSGITVGAILAIALNLLLPEKDEKKIC